VSVGGSESHRNPVDLELSFNFRAKTWVLLVQTPGRHCTVQAQMRVWGMEDGRRQHNSGPRQTGLHQRRLGKGQMAWASEKPALCLKGTNQMGWQVWVQGVPVSG
jgi:hypothetical protein